MQQKTLETYNPFSKLMHWTMAVLLLWQFISAIAHYYFEDSAFEAFFWPTHKPLGVLLFVLVLVRIIWALFDRSKRPQAISKISQAGHGLLYLMMVVIPLVALLRQYGSGRQFEIFGFTLFPGFESDKIQWMMDLGSWLHGELGWALLALIIGHVIMVVWHQKYRPHRKVLSRMWTNKFREH